MSSSLRDSLVDVTLREGSQQPDDLRGLPVDQKIELLEQIIDTGIKELELTAFAPGEWYSDADELALRAEPFADQASILGLYFNVRGAERLISFPHLKQLGIFHTAATERYRTKNYNQPNLQNTIERLTHLHQWLSSHQIPLDVLVLSTCFGDKSERLTVSESLHFIEDFLKQSESHGVSFTQLSLADTEGLSTPESLSELVSQLKLLFPKLKVVAHLHPMPELAVELIHAGIEAGVDGWEGAWCGVGGSPFADGPSGNLDILSLIQAFKEKDLPLDLDGDAISDFLESLYKKLNRNQP